LPRLELVRLGQLPGRQGTLADRIAELEQRLSALRSIVYVWANNDIRQAMQQIKDELGKQNTGRPTQAQQAKVLTQLDSMIRNLSIKPPQQQFAQNRSGGGGGGGGGSPPPPRLPGEVELRLLKDLQLGVNQSTRDAAALADRPTDQLDSLGQRQGDLRGLLDRLLRAASNDQVKLGPEPDNRDLLPEEATVEDLENQELDEALLNDAPTEAEIQKGVNRVGDRMARSRQRLAVNDDPGPVTQRIQDRIIDDLDELIQMARNQQAQQQQQQQQKQAQQQQQQRPGQNGNQPENQGQQPNPSNNPAQASVVRPGNTPDAQTTGELAAKADEWGALPDRLRAAVIEGEGESAVPKYRKLVEDYTRALGTKATE
jgi:hypothetical protein